MNEANTTKVTGHSSDEQNLFLQIITRPLFVIQTPLTFLDVVKRLRESKYAWAKDCVMPEYQKWKDSLPNTQITWLGDDCMQLAQLFAVKAFPPLLPGVLVTIKSLGSDNPTVLADGIFEYAKSKISRFEASLFTFGILQLLCGGQFTFTRYPHS